MIAFYFKYQSVIRNVLIICCILFILMADEGGLKYLVGGVGAGLVILNIKNEFDRPGLAKNAHIETDHN